MTSTPAGANARETASIIARPGVARRRNRLDRTLERLRVPVGRRERLERLCRLNRRLRAGDGDLGDGDEQLARHQAPHQLGCVIRGCPAVYERRSDGAHRGAAAGGLERQLDRGRRPDLHQSVRRGRSLLACRDAQPAAHAVDAGVAPDDERGVVARLARQHAGRRPCRRLPSRRTWTSSSERGASTSRASSTNSPIVYEPASPKRSGRDARRVTYRTSDRSADRPRFADGSTRQVLQVVHETRQREFEAVGDLLVRGDLGQSRTQQLAVLRQRALERLVVGGACCERACRPPPSSTWRRAEAAACAARRTPRARRRSG